MDTVCYWKIAPGEGGFLWSQQRDNDCIALGWNETGNLDKLQSKEEIERKFLKEFPHSRPRQLLLFYQDVKKRHKILANSGARIYGVGTVIRRYRYDESLTYKHAKGVRWELSFWEPVDIRELHLPNALERKLVRQITIQELQESEWKLLEKKLDDVESPFKGKSEILGLCGAPETEQDVIILFAKLSQHLKMRIDRVGTRFPDALLRIKKNGRWVPVMAEFEIWSSRFEAHGHLEEMRKGKRCDYIICWKHDWSAKPRNIKVVELRKELLEIT